MERRDFPAALAGLRIPPRNASGSNRYPIHFRKPNVYEAVLAHVEAGTDEFHLEKDAPAFRYSIERGPGDKTLY